MITRRKLIGSSVAIGVLGVGASTLAGRAVSSPSLPRLHAVLVDVRFDDAGVLANSLAAAQRTPILALEDDLLPLWYDRLAPACAHSPIAFAGVTTERALFLIQTLAADHRLRLLSATVHSMSPGSSRREPLVAWLIGPAA
jgi:hypothetical protein